MMGPNRLFDPLVYLKYGIEYIHYPQNEYTIMVRLKKIRCIDFWRWSNCEDGVYWEAYDYGINICRTIEDLPLKLIAKQKKVLCIGLSTSTELNNASVIHE